MTVATEMQLLSVARVALYGGNDTSEILRNEPLMPLR